MKTAFAAWNNRIAPVFDVARQIHIVESASGRIVREAREDLIGDVPVQKALHLAELEIGILVCGAISRPLQAMVGANGIYVVPFMAGDLREVIEAWLRGELQRDVFAMPGCCDRGRPLSPVPGGSEQAKRALSGKNRDMNGKTTSGVKGR